MILIIWLGYRYGHLFLYVLFLKPAISKHRLLILASVYRDASEAEKRFVRTGDFFIFTVFVGAIILVSTCPRSGLLVLSFFCCSPPLHILSFSFSFRNPNLTRFSGPPISAPCATSLRTRFPGMEEDYPYSCGWIKVNHYRSVTVVGMVCTD